MALKDYIFPVIITIVATTMINYYFIAPRTKKITQVTKLESHNPQLPLSTTVELVQDQAPEQQITKIETAWATLQFSNYGATIVAIDQKRKNGPSVEIINSFTDKSSTDHQFLLVGLDQQTPYYYELKEQTQEQDNTVLVYQAKSATATILKKCIINNVLPTIDIELTVTPHKGAVTPRLLWNAPMLAGCPHEISSGILIDNTQVFEKKSSANVDPSKSWSKPALFGLDNRYFIHAIIQDNNAFMQQAYYKVITHQNPEIPKELMAIAQGPSIDKKTTWICRFYLGQKDIDVLLPVDPRLEKSLDYYGWLAPISKALLQLLKWLFSFLHNYALAIIVLTFLIKLLLLPFTLKGEKNMKEQREMQKKLAYIEQKYKDNPNQLAIEKTELIKKYGVPGLGGCLPLLLQTPIFLAISKLLANAIELYRAPMLWIPDLSNKDPYYILPLLLCLGIMSNASSVDEKQRISMIVVALVVGAFTANAAAGLTLYLAVNALLGVGQTTLMKWWQKA